MNKEELLKTNLIMFKRVLAKNKLRKINYKINDYKK